MVVLGTPVFVELILLFFVGCVTTWNVDMMSQITEQNSKHAV